MAIQSLVICEKNSKQLITLLSKIYLKKFCYFREFEKLVHGFHFIVTN